jgi:hypothetical protein
VATEHGNWRNVVCSRHSHCLAFLHFVPKAAAPPPGRLAKSHERVHRGQNQDIFDRVTSIHMKGHNTKTDILTRYMNMASSALPAPFLPKGLLLYTACLLTMRLEIAYRGSSLPQAWKINWYTQQLPGRTRLRLDQSEQVHC